MTPWRILADDLTGALDTAAAWAGHNAVPVFLDAPECDTATVQAVSTGSRDAPAHDIPGLLSPSLDWLAGSGWAFKKVDSLLRGNSLAELAWLLRSGRFDGAVFAPAYPAQGRFTEQGRHWVGPPRQPGARGADTHPDSLLDRFAAMGLSAQIAAALTPASLQAAGQVLVPDVRNEDDLDALAALAAEPAARRWLWCASAGLAWALARREGAVHGAGPGGASFKADTPRATDRAGQALLLTASRHPVLRAQWQRLQAAGTAVELRDLAPVEALAPQAAQQRLLRELTQLLQDHPRPDSLVVIGGDTLLALCRCAGVRALLAGPSPRAGWGQARLLGGAWDGLRCCTRSGAFGPPDDLIAMLGTLGALPASDPDRPKEDTP